MASVQRWMHERTRRPTLWHPDRTRARACREFTKGSYLWGPSNLGEAVQVGMLINFKVRVAPAESPLVNSRLYIHVNDYLHKKYRGWHRDYARTIDEVVVNQLTPIQHFAGCAYITLLYGYICAAFQHIQLISDHPMRPTSISSTPGHFYDKLHLSSIPIPARIITHTYTKTRVPCRSRSSTSAYRRLRHYQLPR